MEGPLSLGVAAADGSQARELIPGAVEDYVWSPTGDRIALSATATKSRCRDRRLAVVDVASGTVVSLVDMGGRHISVIKFSPEGDQILLHENGRQGCDFTLEHSHRRLRPPPTSGWTR